MNSARKFLKRHIAFFTVYFAAVFIIFLFLAQNHFSLIFDNQQILERFGDQRLYIGLADNLLHTKIEPHVYSLGYPLFITPFIFFAKTTDWQTISRYLVAVQSLLLFPLVVTMLFALFRKFIGQKSAPLKITVIGTSVVFILYELFILFHSADPLPFYLFFGLIPYSEMVAIFTIILANVIFILRDFRLSKTESVIVGLLLSFSIMIRITYFILAIPIIFFYLKYFFRKKESCFFFAALFLGYVPQLIYNFIAYGNIFSTGYFWYWEKISDQYVEIVRNIYHTDRVRMFSTHYLKINVFLLIKKYIHYLLIMLTGAYAIIRKRTEIQRDKLYFFLFINIFSLAYLIVILSYLWSPYADCIDRFLLPLSFFLLISIFYSASLYAKKSL